MQRAFCFIIRRNIRCIDYISVARKLQAKNHISLHSLQQQTQPQTNMRTRACKKERVASKTTLLSTGQQGDIVHSGNPSHWIVLYYLANNKDTTRTYQIIEQQYATYCSSKHRGYIYALRYLALALTTYASKSVKYPHFRNHSWHWLFDIFGIRVHCLP